jgi:hypothetical protein
MPSASKFPRSTLKPAARLRSWRVSLLSQRARYLGTVEARDEKAAEATAVKQFGSMTTSAGGWRCGRRNDRRGDVGAHHAAAVPLANLGGEPCSGECDVN